MSYRKKNILLLVGIILLGWISWQLSFSKTFELKKQYSELKSEKELFSNVSQKLSQLKQHNSYYDSILKSKKITTGSSFQNNLLQVITAYADSTRLQIVNFNTPHIYKTDNASINTYIFTVKGSFTNCLKQLYELEQQFKLGKIVSANFEKKRNFRQNSDYLECTILLQKIGS